MTAPFRGFWLIALLCIGIVAAAVYSGLTSFSSFFFKGAAASAESKLAQASCVVPEEQSDEIFFISCGGIY